MNMEIEMDSLGRLDVEALKQLVALKENSGKLNRLETKRQRLRDELDRVEDQIREFLGQYPEVQGYLASTSGSMRRLTPSGRRPLVESLVRPRGRGDLSCDGRRRRDAGGRLLGGRAQNGSVSQFLL